MATMLEHCMNSIYCSAKVLIFQSGYRAWGVHFFTPSELIGIPRGGCRYRVLQAQEVKKFLDEACRPQWPRLV